MNSLNYRASLFGLTKSSNFRTKDDLQQAAWYVAMNPELHGEVDPELLAKIDAMADESDS
jgi:hypothetical protein